MKHLAILKCILLILLIANSTATAQTLSAPIRIVNPNTGIGGDIGEFSQLLVVNGNPAVAYRDVQRGDLVYVRATDASGTTWGTPITVDATGKTGVYISMQVINGNPAICYHSNSDNNDRSLKYVRATDLSGSSWGTPITVDATQVDYTASLLTVNGNPAIAYFDQTNNDLKYIRAADASGTTWSMPVVVDAAGGNYGSLQIVNGNPAISYYGNGLQYVRANDASGNAWGSPVTLEPGIPAIYSSLKMVNGNPAIAYYDASFLPSVPGYGRDLKYIRATDASGTAWGSPAVIDNSEVAGYVSLEIVNGNPAVSYATNVSDPDLAFVRATDASGNSWATPATVDASLHVGYFTTLQIVNGNPAISYYDQNNGDLKYIRATDGSGTAWTTPSIFDAAGVEGEYLSMQIVNGNPAISYYHNGSHFTGPGFGGLMYARATNAMGTAWGQPLKIDSSERTGQQTSLQVINGNPAISYLDEINSDLKYVRATDASGTSWGSSVIIDASGGYYNNLIVVGGNPAVLYTDYNDGRLKFTRAADANGTAWGTPVVVDAAGGGQLSHQLIAGNPGIAYQGGDGTLKYVRANDALGTIWGAPVTIEALGAGMGGTGESTSLQVVNGSPAIAYIYPGVIPRQLKYVRATDGSGAAWSTPITVDAIGYESGYGKLSLQVANGKPVIAYGSSDTAIQLKFVAALDASGTNWDTPLALVTEPSYISDIKMISTNQGVGISYFSSAEALPYFISGLTGANLPVTFSAVKAYQYASNIAVEWEVENETAIKEYAIEKSSDGKTFIPAATKTAVGNQMSAVTYNWLDIHPTRGNNYYRIQSKGLAGEIKYSRVMNVVLGGKAGFQIYPNPITNNQISLQFISQPAGLYSLQLINPSGQVVLSKKIAHKDGSSTETIDLNSSIQKGYYFLKVTAPDKSIQSVKIVY